MKKSIRKTLCLLLTVVLLFSTIPLSMTSTAAPTTKLYVGGIAVNATNASDVFGDATQGDGSVVFAKEPMIWALNNGIIYGVSDTLLAPQGNATRAQMAAFFERFVKVVGLK